jgi:hypothetical protein
MGRFYFHLQADDQIVPDDEGVELPDLSAAEHEAILDDGFHGTSFHGTMIWLADSLFSAG